MTDERRPDGDGVDPSAEDRLDPRGEELLRHSGEDVPSYEVVDDEAEELTDADDTVDATPDHGDPQDVVIDDPQQLSNAELAAAAARSSRPRRRPAAAGSTSGATSSTTTEGAGRTPHRKLTTAPVRREAPARKTQAATAHKRTTPAQFVRQSVEELRKVKWLNSDELGQYFLVVLVFVLLVIAYVSGLDVLFGWLLLKLFGQ